METTHAVILPPADKMTRKRRWRRLGMRVLRSAALIYVIVAVAMYFLQSYLIFPGASRQGTAETIVKPGDGEELVPLKAADGTKLMGLFGKADRRPIAGAPDKEQPKPTVLFFYGNGDCMNGASYEFDLFRRHGANCMLVDYAGYGMSEGKASEQGCYAAAEAAYQYVLTRPDVDRKKLVAAGWSLGSAVAVELAHQQHRADGTIRGLMTFSAFSSMLDMAKLNYRFLPVELLLKHRFMSEDKLREIRVPYFLGHGKADPAIPYAMSDRLAAAYGGDKASLTRYSCDAAGHNDFFDTGGAPLAAAMAVFLTRVTGG